MKSISCQYRTLFLFFAMLTFSTNADERLDKLTKHLNNLSFSADTHVKSRVQKSSRRLKSLDCHLQKDKKINLHQVIEKASLKTDIPPEIIAAVMSIESNFKPCAISKSGAMGLMQLMPKTAKNLGIKVNKGEAFDIATNVNGGARLLAANLKQENDDLLSALVMYNAGSKYLSLNWYQWQKETQDYLVKFSKEMEKIQSIGWKSRVPNYIDSATINKILKG
ncbi:lytic transglycosylase domain-containing protein [Pseudoalteromonas sp. C12FD-1]|uniref:lytic transglycosylase domain-containing protein n=1 Tax=Pseudoalteromonas sp. C12FD-1 TaxID=3131979 RepID=UPI00307D64DB